MTVLLAAIALVCAQESPIDPWREKVRIRPLVADLAAHTIHSYYVTTPESPDGRRVLFYQSSTPEAYEGEIRILERESGGTRTLVSKLTVEDAHRAACQQWIRGGKSVVFHDFRGGEWIVAIDLTGGAKSWRISHPHPVFSPDGRRIYFNATVNGWTQLCVAELDR